MQADHSATIVVTLAWIDARSLPDLQTAAARWVSLRPMFLAVKMK